MEVKVGIGVFVIKNGKFLMMLRSGAHGAGSWAPPGGKLDYGETFEETSAREVLEETGMTIKNMRFGAVTNDIFKEENKHFVTIWMVSDWESGDATIMEPEKCTDMQWVTFDSLPEPLFLPWRQLLASSFITSLEEQIR